MNKKYLLKTPEGKYFAGFFSTNTSYRLAADRAMAVEYADAGAEWEKPGDWLTTRIDSGMFIKEELLPL